MKKTLLPLSILSVFVFLLCGFFVGSGIYVLVVGINDLIAKKFFGAIIEIIVGLYTINLCLYALVYYFHNRVVLYDDKIIVTGHLIEKKQGLQFSDEIRYDEIKDVAIICANANSLKKRIKNAGYSSLRPYTYFEILLKNDDTKWVYIECFTIRQRKLILSIINEKAGLNLSYGNLERKDFSIYRRRKKK